MGHELTNLFILAGSLFLLFIGYLAYQLASTEKGTRNLLLFFVVCILIFIFSIHFLMYRFENASEAQPKIIEKYEIVRGKTEQLIQGKGFGLLTVYNMSLYQLRWLNPDGEKLRDIASNLYMNRINNTLPFRVQKRCCDFQLLEEKCKEYTKMISTKSFQELEYDEIEEDCAEINI